MGEGEITPTKLELLLKILEQEKREGFQDSTVIGGLDRFLQLWADELKPVLGEFNSYSVLTPVERRSWTENTLSRMRDAIGPDGPAGAVKPSSRKASRTTASRKRTGKPSTQTALQDSVTRLKRVTKHNVVRLKRLGVEKVGDLLYLFPYRHNDFASIRKVSELELGKEQTVVVTVWEATESRHGPKRSSTQAVLSDDTGTIRAIWFNQGYLANTFKPGTELVISGKVKVFRGNFVFESPEYELLKGQEELVHTGRIVPIYPSVEGLPQRTLRRLVKQAIDAGISKVVEFLPEESRHRTGLMGLQNAIAQAHYPDNEANWKAARRRLAFNELLLLQLAVLIRKREWQQDDAGIPLETSLAALDRFLDALPFTLTAAQSNALNQILGDLRETRPMSRLLQGDVGSGKTVVAVAALLTAVFNGYQGALMVPTEILAEQHFLTIVRLLSGVHIDGQSDELVSVEIESFPRPIAIGLLLGSLSKRAKQEMHRHIAEGRVDIVIGTHALIQGDVEIPRLALAVVDEQHRFGVMQRASIREKGRRPHLLAMSATPIPRSLALTLYGELGISVIDEMPPGRKRIRTRSQGPDGRSAAYNFIRKQVEEKRQAFIICPLIEESEALQTRALKKDSEARQIRAAVKEYERLSTEVFPDLRLGLLHGRLALREKELVMEQFQRGELDVMVSTPVVEVGIDVPNATVMLVDSADRFGLAQLHQFRGRVGRGRHKSYCILLADKPGKEARERLKLVERIHDGFELAEEDLRLRGPGDYMGTRQSGLPDLKVARITDHDILATARQEAARILEHDPGLSRKENARIAERLSRATEALPGEMS